MKRTRLFLSATLALVLAGSGFGMIAFADETTIATEGSNQDYASIQSAAQVGSKEEVVYANLSTTGAVSNIYVVNEFDVTQAGTLTDYGSYSSVSNLTSESPIKDVGDVVTTTVGTGEFYYQGTLSNTNLPWVYNISYTLDGKAINAKDVAGKSGALQIHLTTKKNPVVDSSFYDNYMQQITITLDSELCSNIKADKTTIANSGKDKVITATVMPSKDGDVTVSSDVQSFAMDGIQIAALPFSMPIDLSGTDDLAGQMSPLVTGVASLNDGMSQLAVGSKALSDGFNASDLDFDTSSFKELSVGLRQIAGGLTTTATYLSTAKGGFDQSYAALGTAIDGLPTNPAVDSPNLATAAAIAEAQGDPTLMQELTKIYLATGTVKGTFYNVDVQAGLMGLSKIAGALTDQSSDESLYYMAGMLTYMANEIDKALDSMDFSQLQQLGAALTQLSAGIQQAADGVSQLNDGVATLPDEMQEQIDSLIGEYDKSDFQPVSFTSPRNQNPSLVQFVITSDSIQLPKTTTTTDQPEEAPSIVDKFLDLFR